MPQITRRKHLLLLAVALLIPLIGIVAVAAREGDSGSEVAVGDRDSNEPDGGDGAERQGRGTGRAGSDGSSGDDVSADDEDEGDGADGDGDSEGADEDDPAGDSGEGGASGAGSGGDERGGGATSTTTQGTPSNPGSPGGSTPTTRPAPVTPTSTATTPPPTPTTAAPPTAVRDTAAEGRYLSLLNNRRASEGKPPLSRVGCLDTVAKEWAAHLGATGQLAHNPNVAAQITQHCGAWTGRGENVGYGPDVPFLDNGFWNSPPHKANILGNYNKVGIGVYRSGPSLWICVVFMQQ